MNHSNSNAKAHHHLASLNHCSEVAQYALRAECESDCLAIRAVLAPWLVIWREDQVSFITGGQACWMPDRNVVFSLQSDSPNVQEIRWLIDAIVDCHVASESLSEVACYTGERLPYTEMPSHMCRPTDQVIAMARDSAQSVRSSLVDQFERAEEAAERFDAELGNDASYKERLQKRYAKFWQTNFASPEERDNEAFAQAAGILLAADSWKRSQA